MSYLKSILAGALLGMIYVVALYLFLPISQSFSSVPLFGIFLFKIILMLLGGLYMPLYMLENIAESYTTAGYEVFYVAIILGIISTFLYKYLLSKIGVIRARVAALVFFLAISFVLYFIGVATGNANDITDPSDSSNGIDTSIKIEPPSGEPSQ